jgi:predicted ATPase/DNA-binding CsgD family transcriptional regulator
MIDDSRVSIGDEPDSFVGREQELSELLQLAASKRAVTLSGAGGIGKTRLLLRLMAALGGAFPDGTWLIELADLRQPELVVSRVAAAIGVAEEPGIPLLDTLADALRTRRLLLALDNCEHLVEACASLCQRLLASSPGLRVLATSRESLRMAAEAVWPVPPLSLPPAPAPAGGAGPADLARDAGRYDSVRLFAERAAAASAGFALGPGNAAAVVAVCRTLDGLPLAIELAAAWVRVLSVDQIAARLGDRFQLLTTRATTTPPRQRTLRAAIDWSHDLLTPAEQVLLRRLSVFAGWSLEMAEEVCADERLPAAAVLDLLEALADKSLVEVEPGTSGETRYRMLETIREYAGERLAAAGETAAVRARMRDYTLDYTEHAMAIGMALVPAPWSDVVAVFRRYDADADNAREVLRWCLDSGDAENGLRICTAVRPCWLVRGTLEEGAEWLDAFLGGDLSAVPAATRGQALVGRAQLALASDPQRAEDWAADGLRLCAAAGDSFWMGTALNLLAEAALHTGRPEEAGGRAEEALLLARDAGDRWNEGYALGTRATAAGHQGDLREAQQHAEAALAVMRDIDQRWGAARALLGLGELARLRRDPDAARQEFRAALGVLREIDAGSATARCLTGLGRIAIDQGDLPLARSYLAESLRLSLAAGSRIGIARGLSSCAALAAAEGDPGRAVELTAAAASLRESAHLPPVSGARVQRYLDDAASLGGPAVSRLWTRGLALSPAAATDLALQPSAAPAGPPSAPGPAAPPAAGPAAPDARPELHVPAPRAAPEPTPRVTDAFRVSAAHLTPREREVIGLIARGCSNKAIASQLFISPATAARHVANILAKLGFTSRSQVAAWAASSPSR